MTQTQTKVRANFFFNHKFWDLGLGFWCVVILAHTMQGKNWIIVINNYTQSDVDDANKWDVQYLLFSHEVGNSGTPHIQGWVQFKKNMRLTACKKVHKTAHWELCRGSIQQNEKYCRKDGNILLELGEIKDRES